MGRHVRLRTGIIITTLLMASAPVALGAFVLARAPRCPVALVAYTGSSFPADGDGRSGFGIRLDLGFRTDGEPRGMRVEFWRPARDGERATFTMRSGRSLAARVRRVVVVGRAAHGAASTLLRCVLGGNGESAGPEF